ncbi:MAG: class I SAM-dependent methyltransferase [Labilithrix sp.]|nr:class I SAM-dependent methyltransferase [Labilithrix sp.]MCW5810198.1 class I SAM-dependent methyltransferase [Labilithrix sp.]
MPLPEERREHWEKVFREKAEDDVSWFQERPRTSLELIARTGAGRSAKIVDVGGGASRLVDGLLEVGHRDVTVVDISEAALARSRARVAERVRWIVSDVLRWTPEVVFDVWHDRAVFHFMVRPEDREVYRATMLRALARGGHAIVATFAASGPERCSGLPVQRYEPEELAAELGPELRLVESLHEEHVTPAGKVQAFQFSRFRRAP